ncbi:MAG: hypothetical protein SPJ78_00580 [Corynebacterium camporealensis]|uniref:hypothetical protein n=1 Tax=Corynebacterium camporealensis TaxID=161896 RepID=UPI002A91EC38|nr:hypothetical protein [Corynebacterium camporealensis]MDY5839208.1 hypothetical protein [Corynebacterium camporealensis]
MSQYLYMKTTLSVPGVGSAVHVAEMREQDANSCTMLRMVALDPNEAVAGIATPAASKGNADTPQEVVPHPNTYDNFPNISAEQVAQEEFETLWSEAVAKFGELS